MALQYPDRGSIKIAVRTEVMAYIDAIMILGSLRGHLESIGVKSHIEKKIDKKEGGYKTPDLLICSDNYIIVDHKYTESTNETTLAGKIEEVKEYDTTFVNESVEFEPEIVMITPAKIIEYLKRILDCPVTWGYTVNGEICINQSIGLIKDTQISSLFKPTLFCPKSRDICKYKFIISHSPLSYTACQVYTILWTLHPPAGYFAPEFDVDYKTILDQFNHLFPPWLSPEVKQLNVDRLRQALTFLQNINWIKWLELEDKVLVFKNKGRLAGDTLEYFINECTDMEFSRKKEEYELQTKQLKTAEMDKQQKLLGDFFGELGQKSRAKRNRKRSRR